MELEDIATSTKVSWLWKVVIVCVALTLGLLTVILVPPMPEFSVAFASASASAADANNHLSIGLSVTNSAAAAMSYDRIAAAAFLDGGQPLAAADMRPFEQSGGERSNVWFGLDSSALPAEAAARIVVWARASYGGPAWPWKDISITVVCDGVRVSVSPFATWPTAKDGADDDESFKCDVDGLWRWRERWMFVGVFLVPFLLYLVVLYCQNFVTYPSSVGSSHNSNRCIRVRDNCILKC